jgi:hypothetical protein
MTSSDMVWLDWIVTENVTAPPRATTLGDAVGALKTGSSDGLASLASRTLKVVVRPAGIGKPPL